MKKTVLLALMKLDIGGAETHAVELAKELTRRGWRVLVASNGGVYVKELTDAGIKHYSVPLQNKNPFNMLKSLHLLKKIIREEKPDIVHSHARIPSFLLGILHKRMHFPFVTTAHWVFSTKHGLRYLTDWGEKTLAVSEDIKTYLMENYNIPASDIPVTINGIDTDKFSPENDGSSVRSDFGIPQDAPVIAYVSRMDADRSLAAHQLIDAFPNLCETLPDLHLIVVGGGNDFDAVKAEADAANTAIGEERIRLTGGSTDIARLISPADLFVGVSRAALEAMAAGKPTIIAGNEGYIGLFTEEKIPVCIETNFCCRGCKMSSSELLCEDILAFFKKTPEEKAALSAFGREYVKKNYSVGRMTDDTEALYAADFALHALPKKKSGRKG